MFCECVIVAGGSGSRMNSAVKKQYIKLNGKEIISRSVDIFHNCVMVDSIIIVAGQEDREICDDIIQKYNYTKVRNVMCGGATRLLSVYNGLKMLDPLTDIVIVHDAVRPFVTVAQVENAIGAAVETGASALAVPVVDTIKRKIGEESLITLDRSELVAMQTPQIFKRDIIMQAYEKAVADKFNGTDDCSLVERMGNKIKIVDGSYTNIKITTEADLIFAEAICNNKLNF